MEINMIPVSDSSAETMQIYPHKKDQQKRLVSIDDLT